MSVGSGLAVGELAAIARQVAIECGAGRSAVDLEDAVQEALAAMLATLRGLAWQPRDLAAYLAVAARWAMREYLLRVQAPVRCSSDWSGLVRQAKAAERASVVALDDVQVEVSQADDRLAEAGLVRLVRRRLREATADAPVGHRAAPWRVLVEEESPADAAAAEGVPVREVYAINEKTKRRLLRDARLRALWRDVSSREE